MGDHNKYQIRLLMIFIIQVVIINFIIISPIFTLPTPEFICNNNEICNENNGGCVEKLLKKLSRETIATEYELYCEKRHLRNITQSIIFIGGFFGLFILTFISEKFGKRNSLMLSYFTSSCGTLSLYFAKGIEFVNFCYFFAGFGSFATIYFQYVLLSEQSGIFF